ncbi:MAG: glycosyltransferase family 2 protein [Elusimicrobiota bacterium]
MTFEELSVVIPAYNEAECIEAVVRSWRRKLVDVVGVGRFRIIVVDDGSLDETGEILDSLAREFPDLKPLHVPNGGYGNALRRGYEQALMRKPEFVFQTDSDEQFKPDDFERVWEKRERSSTVLGWRKARRDPLHRLAITRLLRGLVGIFFGVDLKDSHVPYRLYRARYLEKLLAAAPSSAFATNIFLAVLAAKDGQNLFFVPVDHRERRTGTISIVRWKLMKICFRSAVELLDLRLSLDRRLLMLR